jgi:hypothetical protein
MALNLQHQTKVQYLRRLREMYRSAKRLDCCRLASRILGHLESGDCTVTQMQTAWNMSAAEWAVRAAQLQIRADKWTAYKAAEALAANEAGD